MFCTEHEPPEYARRVADGDLSNHIVEPATEEVELMRTGGPLGLSIVGGIDHSSHPFGADEPGIFISKVSVQNKKRPCVNLNSCYCT